VTDSKQAHPTREERRLSSRHGDPIPVLTARWYLVVVFSNGTTHELPCVDQADAEWRGSQFKHSTWRVEREMVGPRVIEGPVRRNRIVTEPVTQSPEANASPAPADISAPGVDRNGQRQ
jgi:hypothetical protein